MNNQRKAYIYAISAVLLWSTVATAFKIALAEVDFLHLLLYSSMASTIVLLVLLVSQNKISLLNSLKIKDIAYSAILGFLNPFLYYLILFKAYSILPAQEAQPLNYTWPLMLVLLSVPFLGQKINIKSFLGIIVSFIGVMVISTRGNILGFEVTNPIGAFLALGSSLIWASFWLLGRKDSRDETLKLFLSFAFGSIYILATVLIISEVNLPSMKGFIAVSYVGIFEMGLTFVLWAKALKLTERTDKISGLIYLSPFISLIFIKYIVGETIMISSLFGLILIVCGIILQKFFEKS